MQWAVVEMANHPEIQSRCQREISEMIPGERLPSLDDKPRLPYAEAVILEIMRLRAVVPFLVPRATLRDTKVLEYDIPKESMIISNAYSAHRNKAFWGDPENFRPERFLDKDNNIINSNRMIGFGLGKRSCLGEVLGRQKVFLFFTSLVQRFHILPPEGQKSVDVKEIIVGAMTPSPYEVRLIPREKPTQP
jgi:cytochrome P450